MTKSLRAPSIEAVKSVLFVEGSGAGAGIATEAFVAAQAATDVEPPARALMWRNRVPA
jgi:hypothetical protein